MSEAISGIADSLSDTLADTGDRAREALMDPDYWVRHISAPVRFHDGMQALVRLGCRTMLEIGPKPTPIICVAWN